MEFTLKSEPSYLRVQMTGLPTADEVRGMFQQLAKMKGPPRTLIELLVDQCLSFLDTMKVMSDLPLLGLPGDYRLALLITDEKMRESAEFAETVAVNRGIAVRVFDQRDAALAWLAA